MDVRKMPSHSALFLHILVVHFPVSNSFASVTPLCEIVRGCHSNGGRRIALACKICALKKKKPPQFVPHIRFRRGIRRVAKCALSRKQCQNGLKLCQTSLKSLIFETVSRESVVPFPAWKANGIMGSGKAPGNRMTQTHSIDDFFGRLNPPQQRSGHARRGTRAAGSAAVDRGRRGHRKNDDSRPPRRVADHPRRRSGPHPASDVHAPRGGRDAAAGR